MRVCVCVRVCVCMCVCMCVHVYVYVYMYVCMYVCKLCTFCDVVKRVYLRKNMLFGETSLVKPEFL